MIMEQESIGRYISIIARNMHYFISKKVEKYNIGRGQIPILTVLYHHEGISQDELRKILRMDKIMIAKGVRNLVEQGYIRKETDEKDKRIRRLYVTNKGLEIKSEIMNLFIQTTSILSDGLTEEENIIVRQLLKKMADNICQASSELKPYN